MARITSSFTEVAATPPTSDDVGRVSSVIAEAAVTVPTADTIGRVSSVIAEAAVTVPIADAVGRLSTSLGIATVQDTATMQVGMVVVEAFTFLPSTPTNRSPIEGGVQGAAIRIRNL